MGLLCCKVEEQNENKLLFVFNCVLKRCGTTAQSEMTQMKDHDNNILFTDFNKL